MSNSGKLAAKAGIAYTIGNVLLKGISFLTLPIFSRLLTAEEFGLYNLYVSYETIMTIFVGLCLYGSLRTGKYDYRKNFEEYISSALVLSMVAFLAILCIANILYPLYNAYFEFDKTILNILLLHSYAMFLFQFYNTKLALDFRYKEFLIASSINSIGGTLLSIVLITAVFRQHKHIARIYGYAMVPILVGAVIWFLFIKKAVREKHRVINFAKWNYALKISLPLVVHTFSQQILNQFDRIMIKKMVNASAVGIYGFVHTIANILQIIVQSMDSAWSAWMYEQLNKKEYAQIKKASAAYILLMNVLYIGFISLAPDVIRIAGTKEYYEGTGMVVPLAFAIYFIFLYSLPVHIEYYYKKTNYIALGTSVAAGINFVLNYIGILNYGYQAAAWATLLSYFLLFIFHWIIAKRIDRTPMFPVKMIGASVAALVLYSLWILGNIENMLLRWGVMVLCLAGVLCLCRDTVRFIVEMLPQFNKNRRK